MLFVCGDFNIFYIQEYALKSAKKKVSEVCSETLIPVQSNICKKPFEKNCEWPGVGDILCRSEGKHDLWWLSLRQLSSAVEIAGDVFHNTDAEKPVEQDCNQHEDAEP